MRRCVLRMRAISSAICSSLIRAGSSTISSDQTHRESPPVGTSNAKASTLALIIFSLSAWAFSVVGWSSRKSEFELAACPALLRCAVWLASFRSLGCTRWSFNLLNLSLEWRRPMLNLVGFSIPDDVVFNDSGRPSSSLNDDGCVDDPIPACRNSHDKKTVKYTCTGNEFQNVHAAEDLPVQMHSGRRDTAQRKGGMHARYHGICFIICFLNCAMQSTMRKLR